MTTFYLIRHGEKEATSGDPSLTPLGRKQAEQTGQFLKQFPISLIVTSPFLRTQQTAQTISKHIQVPVYIDELLRERMNWGDRSDQTFEEFIEEWMKASGDRHFVPVAGNSAIQTGQHLETLTHHLSNHNEEHKHIALVTHGGSINDFLQNIFPSDALSNLAHHPQKNPDLQIPVCSITILHKTKDSFELRQFANSDHLTPP